MSSDELIGKKGKDFVSIPVPHIDIPHFTHGPKQTGGVGQGEGDVGDVLGSDKGEGGGKKAGEDPGEHLLEVDVTLDELARILGEELELPNIEPRGQNRILTRKEKYSSIRNVGPESLRHFKRTHRQALKRQMASGTYSHKNPIIIPVREDRRYRAWKETVLPQSNAVIIYMMDVSGSMGDEQKEVVRITSFWLDTWLRSQYKDLESRYIIHDARAKEVDRDTFFRTRESGGTMVSTAYQLCLNIMEADYPAEEWNVYPFHFSDGDNWSMGDTEKCIKLLKESILPRANLFCYGQVESPYGSGQLIGDFKERLSVIDSTSQMTRAAGAGGSGGEGRGSGGDGGSGSNMIVTEIKDKDGVYDAIRAFLRTGR